jgi:cytochrome bd-type quinol oxidase subunit 1
VLAIAIPRLTFPERTIGLFPLIVILKSLAVARNGQDYAKGARIFAISFIMALATTYSVLASAHSSGKVE